MNFNCIKELLTSIAQDRGVSLSELESEVDPKTNLMTWHIDWNDDLDNSFECDVERLWAAIDLCKSALTNNDLLAAQSGLIRAGIQAHNLMGFFDAIRSDLIKIYTDPRFGWPKFPDGYKIPPEYNYKD